MHKYLRSVGFSELMNSYDRLNLIDDIKTKSSYHMQAAILDNPEEMLTEYKMDLAGGCGLTMAGTFEDENDFLAGQIEPYLTPETITSMEEVFVPCPGTAVCLSALSVEGTVVLPLEKSPYEVQVIRQRADRRRKLMEAARDGDEQAMQTITMEDMDTYGDLLGKIQDNDILTLVDSFFMPTGAECDVYYIMGEILACRQVRNPYTLDRIHVLTVQCSGIEFPVAINDKDLYGHPEPGRRFKGVIWLQGIIRFPGTV